jgi:MFS family permease
VFLQQAFGVYLAYYIDENSFPEATPLDYAFVGGLSISQITFIAPVVTKFNQKFGLRATLITGAVLEAAALISSSFATRVWQLYLAQGVLFGWGCGFQYIGGSGVVPQWFSRRRAFANSIASSGSGLGGLVWCLATGAMIKNLGLSWAFRITAMVAFAVNFICALLMKDRNKLIKPNERAFDIALFQNGEFVLLLVWGFFSMLGYTILLFSLPTFARNIGLSADQASIVGAMVNLGMAVGRPIIGFYSDSVGGINMAAGATFFGSLVCWFVWMFADSYGVLILTAILGGSVCGTFWATVPPLASDAIGMRQLPSGLSIIWISVVVPCLCKCTYIFTAS